MIPQISLDEDVRSIYIMSGSPDAHACKTIGCNKHKKNTLLLIREKKIKRVKEPISHPSDWQRFQGIGHNTKW